MAQETQTLATFAPIAAFALKNYARIVYHSAQRPRRDVAADD